MVNAMRFYYIPSRKLVAAWSPKCACSSLVQWLHHLISQHDTNIPSMKDLDPRMFLSLNGYDFSNMLNALPLLSEKNASLLVLTRDPVNRMRSCYINKFLKYAANDLTTVDSLEPFSRQFLLTMASKNVKCASVPSAQLCVNEDGTFDFSLSAFLGIVGPHEYTARIHDHHFMPQLSTKSEFQLLKKLDEVSTYSSIIRTEDFSSCLDSVNERFDMVFKPGMTNETRFGDDWKLSDDPASMELSNRELISAKVVPSKNCVRKYCKDHLLMEGFKFDFLYFGYEF